MVEEDLLSSIMCRVLSPLVGMGVCRYMNTQMKILSFPAFMGRTRMLLLLYSYNKNMYVLPLSEFTRDKSVRYVVICLLGLKILVNTVLLHYASGIIGVKMYELVIL